MPGVSKLLKTTEVFRCDRSCMDAFRHLLRQCCRSNKVFSAIDPDPECQQIVVRLVQLLFSANCKTVKQPTALRLKTIMNAERYILDHAEDAPSVQEICAATGVSRRTLEYAFSECFGLNPKAYINAVRLNAVRKQLRASSPGKLHVADAANFWGFWHMGQFAADYHKLFGLNPSETLSLPAKPCRSICLFRKKCGLCGRL